jgi:hypothetical protein
MNRKQTIHLTMCARKFPYRSKGEAETFMEQIVSEGRDRAPEKRLHVYKCPFCVFYHIGHTGRTK